MKINEQNTSFFIPVSDGVQCYLRISTKASANKIGKLISDEKDRKLLKISVTTAPEQGKANIKIIELLAKEWKLNKSQIQIKMGEMSRDKLIHIAGEPKMLLQYLEKVFSVK
jgi:uncharacterized protein (TIGR00251 family)